MCLNNDPPKLLLPSGGRARYQQQHVHRIHDCRQVAHRTLWNEAHPVSQPEVRYSSFERWLERPRSDKQKANVPRARGQ